MQQITCCVTGHRDIPGNQTEYVMEELRREVGEAVREGFTRFISGFAEGADLLFAEAVAEYQRNGSEIELIAAIPYRGRFMRLQSGRQTAALLDSCAEVHVTSERYAQDVFHKRNRFMVENASRVIAVYDGRERGGTAGTVRFARSKGRDVRVIPVGRA